MIRTRRRVERYAASVTATGVGRFTADGANSGSFAGPDWLLLGSVAAIWGSSFLWIAISLDAFHPGTIAFVRTLLGATALAAIPAARRPVTRAAWPGIAVIAVFGNAAPAVLFPLAQQRVDSSVAGMLNSVSPVMVLLVAVVMTRTAPRRPQVIGLTIGLVGALLLALPNLAGADAEPLGIALVMMAVLGYAISNNFIPPLQQEFGGPAIVGRALALSAVMLVPYGVWGIARSEFATGSAVALLILGVVGTGFARSMYATLVGSVGAPRASLVGYIIPIVAIMLGVVIRNETVGALELIGTAVVLFGAFLISRGRNT